MNIKRYIPLLAFVIITTGTSVALTTHAQSAPSDQGTLEGIHMTNRGEGRGHFGTGMRPGVFGTVSAINGTSITVTSTNKKTNVTTTYTVDASGATVTKSGAASSVSTIAIGDTVMISGTITGNSVVAKNIRDGIPTQGKGGMENFQGDGNPVIAGTISAINGSTITITNKSNSTYTVTASNATFRKPGITSATISNLVVGDTVVIQGTVSGNSVMATSVLDQGTQPVAPTTGTPDQPEQHQGFFGRVGGFFSHLFGK